MEKYLFWRIKLKGHAVTEDYRSHGEKYHHVDADYPVFAKTAPGQIPAVEREHVTYSVVIAMAVVELARKVEITLKISSLIPK
ncbi:unnamed protein product [Orchesella dallaii]|uniref:Uncharacterized protein n=1 Tax=Orchesella dallaii TaxID=48710 RepID=A0ABP1S1R2_9HEXA